MAGIEGDVWKKEYDRSEDPKREPGPIEAPNAPELQDVVSMPVR